MTSKKTQKELQITMCTVIRFFAYRNWILILVFLLLLEKYLMSFKDFDPLI